MARKVPFLAVGVWLLLAAALGCATKPAATPTPALPATPSSTAVPVGPLIAFDKLGVDLGPVQQDRQVAQTFLIINRGDAPLTVGPVTVEAAIGDNAAEVSGETAEIQPGSASWLPVLLGPHKELGEHEVIVKIPSNDPAWPVALLPVRFEVVEAPQPAGHGPRLRVDKEVVRIGVVPYDWPLYERFTLSNDGDEPLVLQGQPQVRVEAGC